MMPLSELRSEIEATITQVNNEDLLIKLVELGMMPGVSLSVQNKAPFKGPLSVIVNGTKLIIRKAEADAILVKTV